MAYSSRNGRRPDEAASKNSHSNIINDDAVKEFIANCEYPKDIEEVEINPNLLHNVQYLESNPIDIIIAVDGGYSTVSVKKTFPSSTLSFFQIGTLMLKASDLKEMAEQPFISRESMSKLKELERDKLVLPTKNVAYKGNVDLIESVRQCIFEYFSNKEDHHHSLLETLMWFLFEQYDTTKDQYQLAGCPICAEPRISLDRKIIEQNFVQDCPQCGGKILITDVFRFHEVIDNEIGAGGILGYLTNILEHFNIIHTIKYVLENQPERLRRILFIKDGPLAFFGQTAGLHKPMRSLCNFLANDTGVNIVGLEKSGAFVEHAEEITTLLDPGQVYLLNNQHIYNYILPGDAENSPAYGSTSYYSAKMIFKSREERIHVVSIPVANKNIVLNPQLTDFDNLSSILLNIEALRCDMYDNAIVPVALANKLISLSSHPSSIILEKFSKSQMK